MNHTPAPWAVIDPIQPVSIGGMPHKIYPIVGDENNPEEGTGVAVCIIPFEDVSPETEAYVQANAALIAASPDMLEALKYARQFMKPDDFDVAYIDSVIDKATGHQIK